MNAAAIRPIPLLHRWVWVLWALLLAAVLAVAAVWMLNLRGEAPVSDVLPQAPASAQTVERGQYLARVGNCMSCHTAKGGAVYAGGRGIQTPFGTVFTSNLTPDDDTGLGRWSADHFWRAMHHGRSRDGRLLYPAFPYPEYTQVSREDTDAIYAYLRSLPPVKQAAPAHALGFPYNSQAALAVWRAMFFTPGATPTPKPVSAEWARGEYLVRGLGHCAACHSPRNAWGATRGGGNDLQGGLLPLQQWYAPALTSSVEAGVAHWTTEDVVALLRTGQAPAQQASVSGPMADVVFNSTQHLTDMDARAMAVYLQALPQQAAPAGGARPVAASAETLRLGARVYEQQCAQCHGAQGEGSPGAFPALAGNRAVLLGEPDNLVQLVLHGGYAPATAGNPRPHGMPPFLHVLSDTEVAAVLSYVRGAWGHGAAPVSTMDVYQRREARR